jgi:hypothetical protein
MKVRLLADLPSTAHIEEASNEVRTGGKDIYVLSCVGIGYSNIAKKT